MALWLILTVLASVAKADQGGTEAQSQSKLQQELSQYSSYHRGTNHFSEVRTILDQLRQRSAVGAPEAMQKGASSGNGSGDMNPDDETELSRNADVSRDLFEGDIVLTVEQAKEILENAKSENPERPPQRRKRKVVRNTRELWPTNVLYYTFDRDLDDHKLPIIRSAIKAWEDNTCLRFQQGTGRGDYVTFMKGSGCYSHVGRGGGQQGISIGDGCEAVGIAAHEIAHALGFWHEQNRYDRDNYVRIEKQNIHGMALGNFMRISSQMMNDYGVPYDLGSVMHYGSKAFSNSRDLISIRTVDPNYQSTPGQRQRLSFIDVKQMNLAYCSGVCQNQLRCQHDGYPDPSADGTKCNRCRCPLGFGGTLCEDVDQSDAGCGGVVTATSSWQTIRIALPTRHCSWLLKAPRNSHVVLEVVKVTLKCREACSSFLEVKKGPYFAQTGYRFCCPKSWINPITSIGNEMSVIYRSESTNSGNWGIEYRFRTDSPMPITPNARGIAPTTPSGRGMADGTWSQWSAWSQCSASCGGCGLKARRRNCVGGSCGTSLTSQRRSCGEAVCSQGVSVAIDSLCRYNGDIPCSKSREKARQRDSEPSQVQTHSEDAPDEIRNTNVDLRFNTESNRRQRREEATLEPSGCGKRTTFYMCARSSPYFVRLLTQDEMKKRVLSSDWNQPRNSGKSLSPCCNGFEKQGDICVRRRT